jgi:hypothetical protein
MLRGIAESYKQKVELIPTLLLRREGLIGRNNLTFNILTETKNVK